MVMSSIYARRSGLTLTFLSTGVTRSLGSSQ
jgi:hypothetical protein